MTIKSTDNPPICAPGDVVVVDDTSYVSVLERLASNPDVDPDKFQKFLDMKNGEEDRDAKREFNSAMVAAQTKMPTVGKDQKNTQTGSRYSSYEKILKLCKPVYTTAGFAVSFYETESNKDGNIRFNADVMHSLGHTEKYWTDIPLDDKGAKGTVNKTQTHAKGSSISYGRSYLLRMIFNIPTGSEDDDDGNAAGGVGGYITVDQQTTIEDMIKETKSDMAKFLKYMGVTEISEITPAKYPTAIAALEAKRNQK